MEDPIRAERAKRVIDCLKGRYPQTTEGDPPDKSTIFLLPLESPSSQGKKLSSALILVLRGRHDLLGSQQRLFAELGQLIAQDIGEARGKDKAAIASEGEVCLEEAAESLNLLVKPSEHLSDGARAWPSGTIIGVLLEHLAAPSAAQAAASARRSSGICEHAVVWLLSPDSPGELVAHAGLGRGLEVLGGLDILDPRSHPLLEKELDTKALPVGVLPKLPEFRLWTFELECSSFPLLHERYASLDQCKWLLSFPLISGDRQVVGVVDCLRQEPLKPEMEVPTEQLLQRLSTLVCSALEQARFQRLLSFSRDLSHKVNEELRCFRAPAAYHAIVERVRAELGVTHCDLFISHDELMVLSASTRLNGPMRDEEKGRFRLYRDRKVAGLLGTGDSVASSARISRSARVTFEHQRSARNIALAVHQATRTSQLVERQSWLVDELQHALGQPLQGLSDWYTKGLDVLSDCGASEAQLVPLSEGFDLALELVQEARQRLASYAKMGHVVNPSEFRVLQVEPILRHCARFLGPVAQKKRCAITLNIRPVQALLAHQVFLRAAISNLLENAIKYSYKNRESEIIVSLDEEESGVVRMVFENFGVGIPRQDLERIFEPYYRSRVPDAKGERPGSGIGLALVKHAIEHVHDGEVRVTPPNTRTTRSRKRTPLCFPI